MSKSSVITVDQSAFLKRITNISTREKREKMQNTDILRKFLLFGFYLSVWVTSQDKFTLPNANILFSSTWLIGIFTIIAFTFLILALLLHKRTPNRKMNQKETFYLHLGCGFLAYCFFRVGFASLTPKFFPWGSDRLVSNRETIIPLCYFFIPGFLLVLYSSIMRKKRSKATRNP